MTEHGYVSPLLSRHGAVPATGHDQGVAWHYGDPTKEQRALARGFAMVDQSHLGVVTVTGPDRLSWLHSITSAALEDLPPRTSRELMVLSPQGHIEYVASVVDDGETTWLITEHDHSAPLAAWLNRMKFMLRVEIEDVSTQWAAIGESGRNEGNESEPITWVDHWPSVISGGTRYGEDEATHPGQFRQWRLVLVPRESLVDEIRAREASGWILAGTWANEGMRIEAFKPRAATEIDHKTIPHELDWLRTSVHLHKGCYRGQETIARVHNLGRPPRRLVFLHLDGSGHLLPHRGATIFAGEKEVGTVTSVSRHHELGPIALGIVKRSTPEDIEFTVDCDGGAISAGQEVVVPGEGLSSDRPDARGATSREARGGANLNGTMGRFL